MMIPSFDTDAILSTLTVVAASANEAKPSPLWAIPILIGILFILWLGLRGRHDFVITFRGGRIRFRGNFPANRRDDMEDLLHQMGLSGSVTIAGDWNARHILRVTVSGDAGEGDRQRIRNFLKLTLRG